MNLRSMILFGVATVLGLLVVFQYLVLPRLNAEPAAARTTTAAVVIRQESGNFLPDYNAFSSISARPLFRPDRRPEPEAVVETPVFTPQQVVRDDSPPDFVIIGTVTGPNGGVATVRSEGETRRVFVGDVVEDWRIDEIQINAVEVSRDEIAYRLPIGERDE